MADWSAPLPCAPATSANSSDAAARHRSPCSTRRWRAQVAHRRSATRWPLALLLCCAVTRTSAEIPEEDGVLVLDEKSFETAIKSSPFILVEFYAPWCGHCKQFAPEYAAAAKQLKQAKTPVPLAKVDATAEVKIAEEYNVRGYPTIRLFIDGRDQEYTGGRTEHTIVAWVLKKTGPPTVQLSDVAAAEAFVKDNRLAVVAFLDEDASVAPFETAARQLEDVMFAYSAQAVVAARYEASRPSLKMFFPFDEQIVSFPGDMQNPDEITSFVKAHRHPMVTAFDGETAPDIFGDGRPIVFLFRDRDDKGDAAERELRKAAPGFGRRLLVSIAGSSEPMDQRLMDYITVDPEELPTIRLVANPMASMTKFKLEGDVTEVSITSFVRAWEAGQLRAHMKSEPEPTSQPGPVFTLVGTTFESVVKDPTKDVLVEFYAPWCGHCKKLEPVYRDVAKKFEAIQSVTIAKIDATANDVEGIDIEGFPTIKLWRAGSKDDPLDYDGDRDVDSFAVWLEEKVTHAFNREDLKTEL
mmetsp:Transcript_93623/g.265085  ORF Transcript_93623/g.265085 Transcript_93623/m.265085 type:complete len:525 (-) Transcript_93623:53-1627(-)